MPQERIQVTEPSKITPVNFRAALEAGKARQEAIWERYDDEVDENTQHHARRPTFIHPVLGRILDRSRAEGLTGTAYLVAEALFHHMREDRDGVFTCRPRRSQIAAKAGLCEQTVKRHMPEVEVRFGIRTRRRRGPTVYTICTDAGYSQYPSTGKMPGTPSTPKPGTTSTHLDGYSQYPSSSERTLNKRNRAASFLSPPPCKSGSRPSASCLPGLGSASASTATEAAAAGLWAVRIHRIAELSHLCAAAGAATPVELQPRLVRDATATRMPGRWLAAIETAVREEQADPWERAFRACRPWGGVPPPDEARAAEIQAMLDAIEDKPTPAAEPAPEDKPGEVTA